MITSRLLVQSVVLAVAVAWQGAAVAQDAGRRAEEPGPTALLGTAGPEGGDVVVSFGGGLWINAPYLTAGLRIGAGAGTDIGLVYEAPGLLGQSLTLRVGWGAPVGRELDLGAVLETGIATMGLAGDVFGIRWRDFDLYNDWTATAALSLTYRPSRGARITARLGLDLTLADYVFSTFDDARYALGFGVRGPSFALQGEWPTGDRRHLFLRLDAEVPVHAEVTPIGFLPTFIAGLAWSL